MTSLRLFNTWTRQVTPFTTRRPGEVGFYSCGPTVYNVVHIGNLRTFLFEDVLRRHLLARGLGVTQVMNLTDVDDKTIREELDGNLCRCTGYHNIVKAVAAGAKAMAK